VEWKAETERVVLMRLVATLLALAELADRASLLPFPVRCHVLAILRPAEAVIQAFIIAMARGLGAQLLPQAYLTISEQMCMPDGDEPADATRLALRLRVLALTLASLAAQAECLADGTSDRYAPSATIKAEIHLLRALDRPAAHRSRQRAPPSAPKKLMGRLAANGAFFHPTSLIVKKNGASARSNYFASAWCRCD
jgi:hypothetical protein